MITFSSLNSFSQNNLVKNFSFEQYDTCPNYVSQLYYTKYWFNPSWGTPDYYNVCETNNYAGVPKNLMGWQIARTGNAYAGFIAAYPLEDIPPNPPVRREYVEIKLSDYLQAGQKYFVRFYVSLADSSNYAIDDIAMFFSSDTAISDTSYQLHYSPQITNPQGNFIVDKTNWALIAGEYIAVGGELFVTIGNFKDNINTDTLKVSGGGNIFLNSDYYGAYYYIDDVCISTDSSFCDSLTYINERETNNSFNIYPNPTKNKIFISAKNLQMEYIEVYNSIGELVKQIKNPTDNIDLSDFSSDLFLVKVHTDKNILIKKLLLINKN